ncbi:hypothetical protein BDR22DRAFT_894761 [Usnea florida]
MRHPAIPNTLLTFIFYSTLIVLSPAAAAILPLPLSPAPPSSHETRHLSLGRRGNTSTSSSTEYSLKANTKPGNLSTFSNSSSGSTNRLTTTTGTLLNTNPKLGGWCTFHLTYSISDQLGYSTFQFNLYDAEGAGVAYGNPTESLTYRWLDQNGNPNFNKPALHFGSRLPYDITVLPHPHENLTWAYNEFSMEIPYALSTPLFLLLSLIYPAMHACIDEIFPRLGPFVAICIFIPLALGMENDYITNQVYFSFVISRPDECTSKNQKPITVGTDPVVLSVGCFQNTGGYKREALVGPDVDPYGAGRKYAARSEIDGGWSC